LAQPNPLPHPGRLHDGVDDCPEDTEAANTDRSFRVFADLQAGHSGLASEAFTSSSNFFLQSLHSYSKIGIATYSLDIDITTPTSPPATPVTTGLQATAQVDPNAQCTPV
jgi:hypothetical protein